MIIIRLYDCQHVNYLEPILDRYAFKDSFFGVCTLVGKTEDRQTWQCIASMMELT